MIKKISFLLIFIVIIGYQASADTENDIDAALKGLEERCSGRDYLACYLSGVMHEEVMKSETLQENDREKYRNKAVINYKKACNNKIYESCVTLGNLYLAEKNNRFFKFYERACRNNIGSGCSNLGYIYNIGLNKKISYKKALLFYEKACDMKDARGCYNLSVLYYNGGKGVARDYEKALRYADFACRLRYENGCLNHKKMLDKGGLLK